MASERGENGGGALSVAVRAVLRPLVKVLIARGVTAPDLYRTLKALYVEVAERDFPIDDRPPTDSRISVLTGVHRKDVRALRAGGSAGDGTERRRLGALASVVGRWLASPEYANPDGSPRSLPRAAADEPSFDSLVASVSTDIRSRTVLDELLRQKIVALDDAGTTVSLNPETVLGPADPGQQLHFFAANLSDHISAAAANLLDETREPPFLERAVFYNRLAPGSVDGIEAEARRTALKALDTLNRLGHTRQAADRDDPDAIERFRFGVYFFRETEQEMAPDTWTPDTPGQPEKGEAEHEPN